MIDFVLMPDGLSANFVRQELAKHSPTGIKVGNFSALLDALQSTWVLPTLKDDWSDSLRTQAMVMDDVFWSASIQVDAVNVLEQLDESLQHILKSLSLTASLSLLPDPKSKAERYFNDLAKLHQNILEIRPAEQQLAKQWLAEANSPPLGSLTLYLESSLFNFNVWQQEIVDTLTAKNTNETTSNHVITALLEKISSEPQSDFTPLVNTLFTDNSAVKKPERLQGVSCRDALETCDVVASMIQQSCENGEHFNDIAVVYPVHSNYPVWLGKAFKKAGITASNLPEFKAVFDWQTALLRDLLLLKSSNTPPMAWMSVLSNPLMPWRDHKKRIGIIEGDIKSTDPKVKARIFELADSIVDGFLAILLTKVNTADELLNWLHSVSEGLKPLDQQGLTATIMDAKITEVSDLFTLYSSDNFEVQSEKVLNQLQPSSLNMEGDKPRNLDAVTVLSSNEVLLAPVKHLFVIGFNQGHYMFDITSRSDKTVLDTPAWLQLSEALAFNVSPFEQEACFFQNSLKSTLRNAKESLTFFAAEQDFNGEALHLSETALDLALCFMALEEVNPESLFKSLTGSAHPLLSLTDIAIEYADKAAPKDIDLQQNLLALHTVKDGSQRPESPSSLEKLMVSPLAWLLSRQGLMDKEWQVQTLDIMLQGTIAHKVFELYQPHQNKPMTDALFDRLFKSSVDVEASFLADADWKLEYVQLSKSVKVALEKFGLWLAKTGWSIDKDDVEKQLQGSLWGIPVKGFVDVILKKENQALVLDYKNSKSDDRLKRLNSKLDLQTYIYRELHLQQEGVSDIHSGYYTLSDQVLVLDQIQVDAGITIKAPTINLAEQSELACANINTRLAQLKDGKIELNTTQDEAIWKKSGIKAYALNDNPVVIRFMKEKENA